MNYLVVGRGRYHCLKARCRPYVQLLRISQINRVAAENYWNSQRFFFRNEDKNGGRSRKKIVRMQVLSKMLDFPGRSATGG